MGFLGNPTPEKMLGRSMYLQVQQFHLTLERHESPLSFIFIRVGLERSIDELTPRPPPGGVWWWYQWSSLRGSTAQTRVEGSMRTPIQVHVNSASTGHGDVHDVFRLSKSF